MTNDEILATLREAQKVKPERTIGAGEQVPTTPPPMLVDELIPVGSLVLIAAEYGAGKTFLAEEIGLALATGTPVLGQFKVPVAGNVLYLQQDEDAYSFQRTCDAILRSTPRPEMSAEEAALRTTGSRLRLYFPSPSLQLGTNPKDWDRLAATANGIEVPFGDDIFQTYMEYHVDQEGNVTEEEVTDEHPGTYNGCQLIVIDSLREVLQGDENSSELASIFMNGLRRLRTLTGATILVLHHFNKQQGIRGSVAFPAGFSNIFTLHGSGDDVRTLKVHKRRLVPLASFKFEIESIDNEDGSIHRKLLFKGLVDSNGKKSIDEPLLSFISTVSGGVTIGEIVDRWMPLNETTESCIRRAVKRLEPKLIVTKEDAGNGRYRNRYSKKG